MKHIHENDEQKEQDINITNYLRDIKKIVADIKFNVNLLTEQNQLILSKLNLNTSNQRRENRSPTPNDELNELSFPLRTIEKVEFLQHILTSNKGLKERMLKLLATIGGSSYEEMSKRMFLHVFTNELASLYSWMGGKGKLKLHNLEVMKLMLKVVRKTFPNVTEKEFETKCKDWFRHAKHRFDNQKRRQNKTNANDNIGSQEAPVVRDDGREALACERSEVDASSISIS